MVFEKSHSAQHSLLIIIEKQESALGEKREVVAIFMDLSKAFDILNHRPRLAFALQPNALKQLDNYHRGRFQMIKINSSYSSWSEIIAGVPQGSIF